MAFEMHPRNADALFGAAMAELLRTGVRARKYVFGRDEPAEIG
jgi:hypothetical protein